MVIQACPVCLGIIMKISVALCTYNGANYLEEQLLSVLQQTRLPDEIVCCDDGSTDATPEILNRYAKAHPRILSIRINKKQLGARKNFEQAISYTTGDVIFLCDQDDIWHAKKVEKQVAYLQEHPEALGVFCNGDLMDEKGQPLGETMWDALYFEPPIREKVNPGNLLRYILLNGNICTGTALAFRKSALQPALPFFLEYDTWHDHWLALCLAASGALHLLDKILLNYRVHQEQQVGFPGRAKSAPDFRKAVHATWLEKNSTDTDGMCTTHLAWGFLAWKRYKDELCKRLPGQNAFIHQTGKAIKNDLGHAKTGWLRRLPIAKRKWKLIKHWLCGGEYLQISLVDVVWI